MVASSQDTPLPASLMLGNQGCSHNKQKSTVNAICKCVNQTMVIVLTPLLLSWPLQTLQDSLYLLDNRLTTTMYTMQPTISMVLKASPGALMSSCDMLSNIVLILEDKPSPTIEKH